MVTLQPEQQAGGLTKRSTVFLPPKLRYFPARERPFVTWPEKHWEQGKAAPAGLSREARVAYV